VSRKTLARLVRLLRRLPPLYTIAAFLTARRVVVRGWSMYPTLRPGERVLFDRLAYYGRRPRAGEIVLAAHPSRPGITMVKRITEADFAAGLYRIEGDAPGASTDSRQLGPLGRRGILARGWLVYWPPDRFRRL
jgi:nickel-type superoxide dismutase maturation protease